ncbi:MAG: ribose-phosphate diphosphokinase [Burkholderiales bacterium]|jgi:ribose-phosphate pyrophosphokinase|nr:ribose-phosphate diphosphokinase [Burkholderiales bacterium]
MLLYFDDEHALAQRIGAAAGLTTAPIARHRFPDGESKLTLPPQLPPRVVLLRGLDHQPNDKLAELLLTAGGARELGAQRLTPVAPYLAYMRQDMAFAPGEAVSQRILGRLLASHFDAVVTIDPHLHRINALADAVPAAHAVALPAAALLGRWIAQQQPGALLLGPDAEAAQWVEAAAQAAGTDWAVCRKQRHGDRAVQIALPSIAFGGRAVVLVDDVASTAGTLVAAARRAFAAGAASVDVAVTHALFVGNALESLHAAGVARVWSSDSVRHTSNYVGVAGLIAAALAGG